MISLEKASKTMKNKKKGNFKVPEVIFSPNPSPVPVCTRSVRIAAPTHEKVFEDKETVFICAFCQFRTTNEIDFMNHAENSHRKDLSLWCKNCGKYFSNAGVLVSHIKEATCQKEDMIYRCGVRICPFETSSGHEFVDHLRNCNKRSPFKLCVHCHQVFTLSHCLILHMQYECPFKDKNWKNPGEYQPFELTSAPSVHKAIAATPTTNFTRQFTTPVTQQTKTPTIAKTSPHSDVGSKVSLSSTNHGWSSEHYSSSSKYLDSSDNDDFLGRLDPTVNNQPSRRSTRRVHEAKGSKIEPDDSVISKKKKVFGQYASKIVVCPYCNFSAAFESVLEHYVASHKHKKTNACMMCNVQFETAELFIKHFDSHEKDKTNQKDIAKSNHVMPNSESSEEEKHCVFHHLKMSTEASKDKRLEKRKQRGSDTNEPFTKIRSIHEYVCSHCNESFSFYICILVHHTASHPDVPMKFSSGLATSNVPFDVQLINCDFCSYIAEQTLMSNHLSLKHKNCFACAHCGKGFKSPNLLVNHSENSHKNYPVHVMKVNFPDDERNLPLVCVSTKTSSEEIMNNQRLKKSATWASRVSKTKSPGIEPDGLSICQKKQTVVEQPISKVQPFSFYGTKPEKNDLSNITVKVISNGSSSTAQLPVIYLSQVFPMFPLVYVEDFKRHILMSYN